MGARQMIKKWGNEKYSIPSHLLYHQVNGILCGAKDVHNRAPN